MNTRTMKRQHHSFTYAYRVKQMLARGCVQRIIAQTLIMLCVMALISLFSTMLLRWYNEYYETRASLTRRIVQLEEQDRRMSDMHLSDMKELKGLLLEHLIKDLSESVAKNTATIEERATLEMLREKQRAFKKQIAEQSKKDNAALDTGVVR